jgi:hypothetical protein
MSNNSKHRKYNIVFHNVSREKCYEVLNEYVKKVKEYLLSVEDYPQGNGCHAHLSVEYKNQRYFFSVLKEMEKLKVPFVAPRPEAQQGDWGRVHIERMRGTFKQNESYLLGETKDKPIGEVVKGKKYPGELIQRLIALTYWQWCEGVYDDEPVMLQEFDEKYGHRFCEACYDKWHDYIWEREYPE